MGFFDTVSLSVGVLSFQSSRVGSLIGCSQVEVINVATHLPSLYHSLSLELSLLSPARGSLSPQKETLYTRDPLHPWLSCTVSAELLRGLRQVPNG